MHFLANSIHDLPVMLPHIAVVAKNRRKFFELAIREYHIYTRNIRQIILIERKKSFVQNIIMPNALNNVLYNIVNAYNREELKAAQKQRRKEILMPPISAHTLRHTGCTRMAESGFDPKVLQYVMGHSNIAVTMEVYNHITGKERIRKEFDRIDEIMAG